MPGCNTAVFHQILWESHGPFLQTTQQYAEVLLSIRRELNPESRQSEELGLAVTAFGVTTTPMRAENGVVFEILLDMVRHQAQIITNGGGVWSIPFYEQSPKELAWQIDSVLLGIGIELHSQGAAPASAKGAYSRNLAPSVIQTLTNADYSLKHFTGTVGGNTLPVLLFPQEMELRTRWIAAQKLYPNDEPAVESVQEEIQFGFSLGVTDELQPYWFVRLLPPKDGLSQCPIPAGASFTTSPQQQVLWPHSDVLALDDSLPALNEFFSACFRYARSLPHPPTTI